MNEISLTIVDNALLIEGDLTRQTLSQVKPKNFVGIFQLTQASVSLLNVNKVDTAGLAWLLLLLEQAQHANCQLTFDNLPAKLNKLISLSGVDGFLPQKI